MAKVPIASLTLTALIVGVCMFAPVIHAEKPSSTVATRAEPRQFGRDSVYATQPSAPGNPLLAGGQTVDEAGGAPLYATQLTHPSGPVMEAGNDLQPYGRDSVYVAGSPNAAPGGMRGHQTIVKSQTH
jgi:hypothetical protein